MERLPSVSIHLPVCNEHPDRVRRTLDALARLDYPALEVLVVDSNTDDPALWEPVAEHCARLGARFRFFHLGEWPGRKAGALNFALGETAPDTVLIAVLDSDELVRPDWLRRMVTHFSDPAVGFALSLRAPYGESPWALAAGGASAGLMRQDATMLVRRSAIEQAGGWAEWAVAEDAELGLRLMRDGWREACSPDAFVGHPAPQDFAACSRRRFVQVYGAIQACRGHLPSLVSPFATGLSLRQRGQVLAGCSAWLSAALALLLMAATLLWSAALLLEPRQDGFPAMLLILALLLLYGVNLARPLWRVRRGGTAQLPDESVLAETALFHSTGKAVWHGLLAPSANAGEPVPQDAAAASASRLSAVRDELILLVVTCALAAGIAVTYGVGDLRPWLWCGLLMVQALPCLAAVLRVSGRAHRGPCGVPAWPAG